jgi:hypothetical protein
MNTPTQFENITPTIHWTNAALTQLNQFQTIANNLNTTPPTIVSTHTSKSTTLPVVQITTPHLTIIIRDNFHDLNAWIQSTKPLTTPLSQIYPTHNYQWYLDQIKSCREYTYSDWTDKEINDPRILRVPRKNGNGWSLITPEQKDQWTQRMTSTEWYNKHWSSATLIVDNQSETNAKNGTPYNKQTTFHRHEHCYAEGITHLWKQTPQPYKIGTQNFIIATNNHINLTQIIKQLN